MTTEELPLSASTTSLLDKPLHQLTEDDISQLTREDFRRYLKQKGMRRPSWNKSQAIQQVIMLKALLEPTADSDGCSRKLHITHRQEETPSTRVQKGTSADTEVSVSADESVPGQRIEGSDLPGHNDFVPPGITGVTNDAKGQMTIFYSGKVNVYDDVPVEKAQKLFQLAASPLEFSQESPLDGNMTMCHLTCHLQSPSTKANPPEFSQESSFDGNMTMNPLTCRMQSPSSKASADYPAMILPTLRTVGMTDNSRLHKEEISIFREDNSAEGGSSSRKASVQRYLEKRKDRFKSKKRGPASGSLDVYLSHQIQNQNQNQNEQSSRSYTCSTPPVRLPNP